MNYPALHGISFCAVCLLGFFAPYVVFVGGVLLYALFWEGTELLILSVLIDAQFGVVGGGQMYMYTLATGGILLSAVILKPYIRFYDSEL